MPTFLWSGKNAAGVEEADRVTADSPEASRKILEGRGWTELKLYADEVHNFGKQQVRTASSPERLVNLTPKQELAYLKGTAPGFWNLWSKSLMETLGLALGIAILFAWSIIRDNRNGMIIAGILFVILLGLFFLYPIKSFWFKQTGRAFRRLHTASQWHRWHEVLKCLDELQNAQKSTKIAIGEASEARYRALALAGLGRLDEALEGFRIASEKAKTPRWIYLTLQAGIYRVAKQYDKTLELYREALVEATDKSVVLIDLAALLVQRFDRPAEARQFLAEAEKLQLSETAKLFVPGVHGRIAYREKDYASAVKHMQETLTRLENHPPSKYYLYEGGILTTKAYLAVCNAALGNKAEAANFFRDAEPYMKAVDMKELLSQYRSFT